MKNCSPTGVKPDGSKAQVGLGNQAMMWPTPSASLHNDGEQPETFEARRAALAEKGINGNGAGTPLTMAVKMWPTPAARDHKGVDRQEIDRGNPRPLNEVVAKWPTPLVADSGEKVIPTSAQSGLIGAVHNWSTPRAPDGEKGGPNQSFGAGGEPLPAMASKWATPRSEMARALGNPKHITPERGNGNIEDQVVAFSLPAQETQTHGDQSSPSAPTSRPQLNPAFVEWLMGWPAGWINCASSETASCPSAPPMPSARSFADWQHEMRQALSRIDCGTSLPTQQLSMFG